VTKIQRNLSTKDKNTKEIAKRLRQNVEDAHAAGLVLVVDADAVAIRVMPKKALKEDDLRTLGEAVDVDEACGGSSAQMTGDACKYVPILRS
jgi:methionine synthase II (cobalamin-independent)